MKKSIWVEPSKLTDLISLRYYDPATGKARRVKCHSKEQLRAEKRRLEDLLDAYVPGRGNPDATPLVVLEDYLKALKERGHRQSTLDMKRRHLTPLLESIFYMKDLSTDCIKLWATSMNAKYSVDTVSIRLRDLRAFCNWATKAGVIGASPFTDVPIPTSSFVGRRISTAERTALLENASGWFKDLLIVLFETGARLSEAFEMEPRELDLDRRCWTIPAERCKTKSSRTLPLSNKALAAIQRRLRPGALRVFEGAGAVYPQWIRVKTKARIEGRLRLHDIRHTWASNWKGRGSTLKAMAGWKSDLMMNKYTHVELNEIREDMERGNLA